MSEYPTKPPAMPRERIDRLLDQRSRALAAAVAQDEADRADMLVCAVGADRYALPPSAVSGVIAAVPTAPTLNGPPALVGLFGRGGLTYSAFDLGRLLGGQPAPGGSAGHFVLMRCADPLVALRVDRVLAVTTLRVEAGRSSNAESAVIGYARPVAGTGPEDGPGDGPGDGVVAVLDADRLFRLLTSSSADGA